MSRKVIINVDDLGLSEPINDAVVDLANKRLITASSYMVGGDIGTTTIKDLQLLNIDIGLHLDFTGVFNTALPNSLSKLLKLSSLRRIDAQVVSSEIKQQFDMFEDTFNHLPKFIDGHQHVHQFAVIRECLVNELLRRYDRQPSRLNNSPINSSSDPYSKHITADIIHHKSNHIAARVTTPIDYDLKAWIIYGLGGRTFKKMCDNNDISTNSHFGGVYDFKATIDTLQNLWDGWLGHCPLSTNGVNDPIKDSPISVIMCHPAIANNGWDDEIKKAREQEYQWMSSGALQQLYDKHNVELAHWSDTHLV